MDFAFSPKAEALRTESLDFMDTHVYPAEAVYHQQIAESGDPHFHPPVMEVLKTEARKRGLWNLFLPHKTKWTEGLSNLDYAPLAEIMGRSHIASQACNCSAPDTGNMEVLTVFGTASRRRSGWTRSPRRDPLRVRDDRAGGRIHRRHQHRVSIERDGDEYVMNGRKWWISGAADDAPGDLHRRWQDRSATPRHLQQTRSRAPRHPRRGDRPGPAGVRVPGPRGHCELQFADVRVPVTNIIGEEGGGFAIAQARLGPGRIHHCMRCIGVAERALELMCQRVPTGGCSAALGRAGRVREWIADSRIEIEQARLLTLKTADLMDTVGTKGAAIEISAIKVVVPNMALRVIDRAIQTHGGGGVSATTSRSPHVGGQSPDAPVGRRPRRGAPPPGRQARAARYESEARPTASSTAAPPSAAATDATSTASLASSCRISALRRPGR